MAQYNLLVPNKNLGAIAVSETSNINSALGSIRNQYGSIISECAEMSKVPAELVSAIIYSMSNGVNNTPYKTNDINPFTKNTFERLTRSGVFALSSKIAKIIICNEMMGGDRRRMSSAELDYLRKTDPVVASYLSDEKGSKGFGEHWSADASAGVDRISDTKNPFNTTNTRLSIALGTIWIGQLWDKYATQTNNPIDKVIITIMLPYNGGNWFGGNDFLKNKSWNIDYTSKSYIDKLPKPENKTAPANVINPSGGWVGTSLGKVLGTGGCLDLLTKKQ
jgi:hypothetical protein